MKTCPKIPNRKGPVDASNDSRGRQFLIYGRALPTEQNKTPKICVAKIFAKNEAFARSHFWKLNLRNHKLKKSHGEIIKIQEIHEKQHLVARNFGIFLRYKSSSGIHNLFKEFRDVTVKGAINQMYSEMAGAYHVDNEKVQIINTVEMTKDQLKIRNPRCLQWEDTSKIAFPIWKKSIRKTHNKYRTNFAAHKPAVFKSGKSA